MGVVRHRLVRGRLQSAPTGLALLRHKQVRRGEVRAALAEVQVPHQMVSCMLLNSCEIVLPCASNGLRSGRSIAGASCLCPSRSARCHEPHRCLPCRSGRFAIHFSVPCGECCSQSVSRALSDMVEPASNGGGSSGGSGARQWSQAERTAMRAAVVEFGEHEWDKVVARMRSFGRTGEECRRYWRSANPVQKGAWAKTVSKSMQHPRCRFTDTLPR